MGNPEIDSFLKTLTVVQQAIQYSWLPYPYILYHSSMTQPATLAGWPDFKKSLANGTNIDLQKSLSNHQLVFHPRPCINHSQSLSNINYPISRFTNRCFFSRHLPFESPSKLSFQILPDPWHCGWLQVLATTELKTRQEADLTMGGVGYPTWWELGCKKLTNLRKKGGWELGCYFPCFPFQACDVHPSLLYNLGVYRLQNSEAIGITFVGYCAPLPEKKKVAAY